MGQKETKKEQEITSNIDILDKNYKVLGDDNYQFCKNLCIEQKQTHLFSFWPLPGVKDAEKKEFVKALRAADKSYPGGLKTYLNNARRLLDQAKRGENPFHGLIPQIPTGESVSLTPFTKENESKFCEMEKIGLENISGACFVIVAGGLGERLGYSGIKLELPVDLYTETCFLELYIRNIKEFQKRCGAKLPLAIMTSGDTHEATVKLLEENNFFGLDRDQVDLVKQEKVPALVDNECNIAVDEEELKVLTKPHGHGDVHSLLHSNGVINKWSKEGRKFIIFLQDTNVLVFRGVLCALGVSKKLNLAMNSLTVPRNEGEAVGAICKLVNPESNESLTINVEYNQLDGLLKDSQVKFEKTDPDSKRSPFPGNINVLVMHLEMYKDALDTSKSSVPEFVNPKYTDETKTKFKSPTRLECMMQDFPRLLNSPEVHPLLRKRGLGIGFTQLDRFTCFSAAKNNLKDAAVKEQKTGYAESMASCERHFYDYGAIILEKLGARIEKIDGNYPRILMSPEFAIGLSDIKRRFKDPSKVKISARSSLILEGDVTIEELDLDGHLELSGLEEPVVIKSLVETNSGSKFTKLTEEQKDSSSKGIAIRGYSLDLERSECRRLTSTPKASKATKKVNGLNGHCTGLNGHSIPNDINGHTLNGSHGQIEVVNGH